MAQRLVRLLCKECKQAHPVSEPEAQWLGLDTGSTEQIYKPVGCERCNYAGYRGRTGIYELIEIDDALRVMIHEGASEYEMLRQARENTKGILEDGRRRVLAGETSMEEVMRVTTAG